MKTYTAQTTTREQRELASIPKPGDEVMTMDEMPSQPDILHSFTSLVLVADNWVAMDAAVALMDDDLRELVHAELAPCTNQAFVERYMELDPEFTVS